MLYTKWMQELEFIPLNVTVCTHEAGLAQLTSWHSGCKQLTRQYSSSVLNYTNRSKIGSDSQQCMTVTGWSPIGKNRLTKSCLSSTRMLLQSMCFDPCTITVKSLPYRFRMSAVFVSESTSVNVIPEIGFCSTSRQAQLPSSRRVTVQD